MSKNSNGASLGFWEKLKKPIMVLAPLADVTDAAFRFIIAKYSKYGGADIKYGKFTLPNFSSKNLGGPSVFWTEFVSADGLCHPTGREKLLIDLSFTKAERPIVAQLFTSNLDKMREAATLVEKLGFDGLDINMGCPDKKVEKQCAGASLMKNPKLARELIRAAKEGAPNIPISVKTRTGYNKDELETWLPELLAEEPAVITVHARTRKEMSDVPAKWERVKRAVEIRDELKSKTLIFGNGDVVDLNDARQKSAETGCDGVMIGRGIFGNPWLFKEYRPGTEEKLKVLVEHTKLFEKLFGKAKNFAVMKKHFKAYVNGFDGAKELRVKLMETNTAKEVQNIIKISLKSKIDFGGVLE